MEQSEQNFYVKVLPQGNASDYATIDAQLNELGVACEVKELRTGGRVYRIPSSDLTKLPLDRESNERYIPVSRESGHSLALDVDGKLWTDLDDLLL